MFIESKSLMIASDHGGFELKEHLRDVLSRRGITVTDEGCFSGESVDYPEYGARVARAVSQGRAEAGIVICGTGIGISIAANRFPGVRSSLCHNAEYARITRAHNDSNVLALGGRFLSFDEAEQILDAWLETPFDGGRHRRRVQMLDEIC
ncbi:MAG: ribose 5-phosphate isomerase B [Fibrobacterota bacterium]